jgi:hypothetical protein
MYRWHRASRLAPAEDGVAHAVEEAAAPLSLLAADLRLQLFYAGVSALQRFILNQRRLHERVDCVRRRRAMMTGEMAPWVLLLILALAILAVLLWPLGRLPWP